ncbi:O-antigen ligase family protein [Aliiglaciecola sp. LCG003]|uniref:O-antigen ligase family protein n=1 Tax=Aliiglaciecola sp. LCG003 TaxID=3053655 RepID=UPI0025737678|nr:O-antigen ligase family protein [Aliiglaciecola sp. LCG003]WJG09748.1 O-antigen ligase family protein [Aliiglaciecola sp. LCG003]
MQTLISTFNFKNKLWILPTLFACTLFAFFAGTGSLMPMIAMIAFIVILLMLLAGVRIIFFLLLMGVPTVFVFPNNIIQVLPVVNTERFLFACIVTLMAMGVIHRRSLNYPLIKLEKIALGFLLIIIISYGYALLSGAYKADPIQDTYFIMQYIMGFSGFMIARRIMWNHKQLMFMVDALLLVGIFMTGQAIVQYFLGSDMFVPTYMEVQHAIEGRVTGSFGNSSEYGAVATSILILGIFRYSVTEDAMQKGFLLGLLGLICIAIVLSKTRAPWLAAAISIALIAMKDPKVRQMIVFSGLLGGLIAAIILPIFYDFSALQERFSSLAPIYNRLSLWVTGINMGLQNPFLGVGFGADGFQTAHPAYAIDIGGISAFWAIGVGVPHNEFIHILSLSGFIGFCLFVTILSGCFRHMKNISKDIALTNNQRLFAIYGFVILFNWICNGFFVDTGKFWFLMFFVFSMVGIACSPLSEKRHQTTLGKQYLS